MRRKLSEDEDDLRAFQERAGEETVSFEEVRARLDRDIEKVYSTAEFVAKLRRLADALERGEKFEIQIAGERIYVPVRAEFNIEHEREGDEEEIEFQIKWTIA
jgi:amphi-Trp domain-containing protein